MRFGNTTPNVRTMNGRLKNAMRTFGALLRDDSGATLVEYALVIALIAVVAIVALTKLGHSAANELGTAANSI
jgi:pilus assembly protein Flp/PilA